MKKRKILFVLNPRSGTCESDFEQEIKNFFLSKPGFEIDFFLPDWDDNVKNSLKEKLCQNEFETVVASGGDGTVKLVSEIIYGQNIKLGILPTGSANGLAKNLNIPLEIHRALEVIENNKTQNLSSLTLNNKFCIHLADTGTNAEIIKEFESQEKRGIWGYALALKNVIFRQEKVLANIETESQKLSKKVFMLVFGNGTGYGTGLKINPAGRMDDKVFEIVMVKKISFFKGLQLFWAEEKPPKNYMEIISCKTAKVKFSTEVHLQIDGEYLGKIQSLEVKLNDEFIEVIN
jgi:diacylglycerol kinase family enzyme